MIVSPKGSMKGHNLKTWFIKNKGSLKTLISGGCGLLAVTFAGSPAVQFLFGIGTGALTKLALDALDFFFSEVKV